ELTPEALDALLAGGQLLCHTNNGESRIPLAQLESFFREGLLRVYRTQASEDQLRPVETTVNTVDAAPDPAEEGDDAPPPPLLHVETAEHEEPVFVAPPPAETSDHTNVTDDGDTSDLRISPRYVPRRQINGIID